MGRVSEQQPKKTDHRTRPTSEAFKSFIAGGWAPRPGELPPQADVATYAAQRRDAASQAFAGERIVVPAGGLKVRSNDTDYVFRPHSAFSYLTGLGADREPDSVLVLEPVDGGGHEAVLYFRPRAGRDTEEFYADARYGELWVGVRPSLEEVEAELAITARHLDELPEAVKKDIGLLTVRVVRDADPEVTATIDQAREQVEERDVEADRQLDDELGVFLSEMRLTKDEWEVEQMRLACAATAEGFEAMVRSFPDAVSKGRGERWVEGQFGLVARHSGNGVGYDSIVAAGDHACTLHWIRNTGDVRDGDLLLIDAGVEATPLHRGRHAHPARERPVQRGPAQGLRGRARGAGGRHRRRQARQQVQKTCTRRRSASSPASSWSGACCPWTSRPRSATRAATTAAGWCTAPATTSASTCTTAPRRAASSTSRPS